MEEIRRVRDEELGDSARVIRESFGTVAEEFGFTPENNPGNPAFMTEEKLREEGGRTQQYGLFAENGELGGFVALEPKGEGLFYLERLAVLPALRHRGYGRALLDFAAAEARRQGGRVISIGIIEENVRLRDWYAAYGFVHTGTKRFAHLSFTVGFMELRLEG